jgi:hypothetical protein
LVLLPWIKDKEKTFKEFLVYKSCEKTYYFMHAPLDGAIPGLRLPGIDPKELAVENGAVFCGHYHNHKEFPGNVYSVGALTHNTWSDVGSKAGFIILDTNTNKITFHASAAPRFVELDGSMTFGEMELEADGNYAKVKISDATSAEIAALRKRLMDAGAKQVTIISEPKDKEGPVRGGAVTCSVGSLEASIESYINAGTFKDKTALQGKCLEILNEIGEV